MINVVSVERMLGLQVFIADNEFDYPDNEYAAFIAFSYEGITIEEIAKKMETIFSHIELRFLSAYMIPYDHQICIVYILSDSVNPPTLTQISLICKLLKLELWSKNFHYTFKICARNEAMLSRISDLTAVVDAQRYYEGDIPSIEPLFNINSHLLRDIQETIEQLCFNGNFLEAASCIFTFIQRMHTGRYEPESIRQICVQLIITLVTGLKQNRNYNPSHNKLLHSSIDLLLKSRSYSETEQIVSRFTDNICKSENVFSVKISPTLKRAIDYINENYHISLCLSDVADYVHVNKSYLSQLFRNQIGESYSDYIKELRIQKAKNMLISTDSEVTKIAEDVGFSGHNYFSKVFKSEIGLSPTQFRNKNRKNILINKKERI